MEKGLEAGMEDVAESDEAWSLEAGRRQSRGSYGQLREIVVVNGMKKFSNETWGCAAMSLSRRRGLDRISHVCGSVGGFGRGARGHVGKFQGKAGQGRTRQGKAGHDIPREMIDPQCMRGKQLRWTWGYPMWQSVVVFLCWLNLPAHDQEHDEHDSHLLRAPTDVWKCA